MNPRAALRRLQLISFDVDGVLTDGRITYSDDGRELKSFNVQDGAALKLLMAHGVQVAILTGRDSSMVSRRARELGIVHVHQGLADKVPAFETLISGLGIPTANTAHVGDDLADIALFERAGLAIAVPNAHPAARDRADLVTATAGGEGVARELAEAVLRARDEWPYA